MDQPQLEKKILNLLMKSPNQTFRIDELEKQIHLKNAEGFKIMVKALVKLENQGQIIRTKKNHYALPQKMNNVKGVFRAHERGYGFIIPEEIEQDDIFIPPHEVKDAMNGDIVLATVTKRKDDNLAEGKINKILERKTLQIVGTYVEDLIEGGKVIPDDRRLFGEIKIDLANGLKPVEGHKVVVELTSYASEEAHARGIAKTIIGHRNDPGVDILSIIHKHEIPTSFPEEVIQEASQAPDIVDPKPSDNRRDLRSETIITIDGADAKDLDDAVTVTKLPNGHYKLGVHIADVTHYVKEGSPLDKEAAERGTSVYLVDRVIPMLPHKLSNGICSLNPRVDRLTMSCVMEIDKFGNIVNHEIFESMIKTTERMTYTDVNAILVDQNKKLRDKYAHIVPMLEDMNELAHLLRSKRKKRGAIDFDRNEARILVNSAGHPEEILMRERSAGELLIEDFMLAANETVAEHFRRMNVPFIYRIHEDPDEDKLSKFLIFITNFGLIVRKKADNILPVDLQHILDEVKGRPEEMVVSTVMLRSMQQAKYDTESVGHFGLAADFYTHFTSPIRRYPDLIVHRLIREYLIKGEVNKKNLAKRAEELPPIAEHSSKMERRAVEAERETDELKKAEYMLDKIGERFQGIISSVTNFGLFIELPNTIEGLVHVSKMKDDYYHFHPNVLAMIGERTGRIYRIGDEVEVEVVKVDVEGREIDFRFVTEGKENHQNERAITKIDLQRQKKSSNKDRSKGKKEEKGRKKKKKRAFYENVAKKKKRQ